METQDLITLGTSLACGAAMGIEREYQNKSAGLRTIVLICLGSTVFTMISQRMGTISDDRIAANIITGIGFIGAGVIFKENFNVKGLTTAAVIWVSAACGMLIGAQEYKLSFVLVGIVLLVLVGFSRLEIFLDFINHKRFYRITFIDDKLENVDLVTRIALENNLGTVVKHLSKSDQRLMVNFEIRGKKTYFSSLTRELIARSEIEGIEH